MDISILGSTGSIGTQTLDVIRALNKEPDGEKIDVISLLAGKNTQRLEEQLREFKPIFCSVCDSKYKEFKTKVADTGVKIFPNSEVEAMLSIKKYDMIVAAISGISGLMPIVYAIKNCKKLAIANKEPLVVAGEILIKLAKEMGTEIIPLDSEHSSIFQILRGYDTSFVRKIIITASGGPLYKKTKKELASVSIEEVLNHPTWKMGPKISVDSATLMNKGFEIIEAVRLFGTESVSAIIQRESVIHSIIEFDDGNVLTHFSKPDMRVPIQYALTYPNLKKTNFGFLDFTKIKNISFDNIDEETFGCFSLAKTALEKGGTALVILNAANDYAVSLFLQKKISFLEIQYIIERELLNHKVENNPTIEKILSLDEEIKKKFRS